MAQTHSDPTTQKMYNFCGVYLCKGFGESAANPQEIMGSSSEQNCRLGQDGVYAN